MAGGKKVFALGVWIFPTWQAILWMLWAVAEGNGNWTRSGVPCSSEVRIGVSPR